MREPLSVVVITYNNADTLDRCLAAVAWADEIVVLDSGSTDATVEIARSHGARIRRIRSTITVRRNSARSIRQTRLDPQLDADEILSPGTREIIEHALIAPNVAGFRLPRRERMFWTVQHRSSARNEHFRLFDRRRGRMNDVPVHAAVEVDGPVRTLHGTDFVNDGDADIAARVDKINRYSSGMVAHKLARGQGFLGARMVLYPPVFFLRQYVFKRYFLNGWAGFRQLAGRFVLCVPEIREALRSATAGPLGVTGSRH